MAKKKSYGKRFFNMMRNILFRIIFAVLWQMPWYGIFSGFVWYGKKETHTYLQNKFSIIYHERIANALTKQTDRIAETLSVTNPASFTEYISALSKSTFASAKVSTLQQTARFTENIIVGGLEIIWIIGSIYCIFRIIRLYNTKTTENDIADAVVKKLIPLLEDIKKSQ